MKFKYLDNPRFTLAQKCLESACAHSRAHELVLAQALLAYGKHGPDVSGIGRAHFPEHIKNELRTLAQAVTSDCKRAETFRPKHCAMRAVWTLGREVATRDGSGFYGPQPLPSDDPRITAHERTGKFYRPIDIFIDRQGYGAWEYLGTSTWHATCKGAVAYQIAHGIGRPGMIRARYAKR